ncbi:unannotated protein [freshwater metagenome]|uniref:Unannotated protein n=1 Tax=freshwater metagenome TaxID=449393 RepID=A0A6J6ZQQ7_9ZZZZ
MLIRRGFDMSGLFAGKVAVITGAASGIGAATARRLAAEGAHVVAADINFAGAESVAAEIGGSALELDVTKMAAWEAALGVVVAIHGRFDILFLNAGVMTPPTGVAVGEDPVLWMTPAGYERVTAVNIDGVAYGLMAAIPHLTASGGGEIVMTASIAGMFPVLEDPFYSMTKHAVNGLARSAGPALESRNIRVNAVCPGVMNTNILPPDMAKSFKRISEPSYIADTVVRIITNGATGEAWIAYAEGKEPWPYQWAGIRPPQR